MIRANGYQRYSIWEHSRHVLELYTKRCRLEVEEMTCAAQAAELLAGRVRPGEDLLDVGCGSGYFYHSLKKRGIPAEYYGIDASRSLIEIGREALPAHGLDPDRLRVIRIEDLDGEVDHIVCMNVLSNLDNYPRPLERMLSCARRTVILRESLAEVADYRYVVDEYLDPGVRLRVHVNVYPLEEVIAFIQSFGFSAQLLEDRRTGGTPEMVIGYPHHWKFLVATR